LIGGVLLVSVATLSFGLVPVAAAPLGLPLVPLFCAARMVQGFGAALTMTCVFATLSDAFPDDRGKIVGVAEMCNSLGWTIGPPLGGFLYSLSGFTLPFMVTGILPPIILAGILVVYPESPAAVGVGGEPSGPDPEAGMRALGARAWRLATPGLLLTAAAATMPGTIFAVWDIGFTPFVVERFGFDLSTVGLYFAIGPGMYMLLTSAAGAVVDKIQTKKYMIGAADALTGLCFLSIGPWQDALPPLAQKVLLGVAFAGMGTCMPFAIVPIIPDMHASHGDARAGRTETNEHTTNLVSSLATTGFNAGGLIGPLLAAQSIPRFGFRRAAVYNGGYAFVFGLLLLLYSRCTGGRWIGADSNSSPASDYARVSGKEEPDESRQLDLRSPPPEGERGGDAVPLSSAAEAEARAELDLLRQLAKQERLGRQVYERRLAEQASQLRRLRREVAEATAAKEASERIVEEVARRAAAEEEAAQHAAYGRYDRPVRSPQPAEIQRDVEHAP
jgi:MFS family permease